MIFFSQLLRVSIIDNKQETVGRLLDVVVKAKGGEYPTVSGIMFKDGKRLSFIPYQFIETLSRGEITLNKSNCWKIDYEIDNDEFLLSKDVLDQQIFDVKGIRVVRVNDLQMVKIDNGFSVVGIDVSNKALFRRLGFGHFPIVNLLESKFIDWHNVSLVKGPIGSLQLKTTHEKLQKLHPADVANLIENLTLPESTKLVQSFDKETAAEVLGEVDPKYKDTLLEHISPKALATIMEEMPTDEAVDVLKDLSEHKRIQVFRRLGVRKAKTLHHLSGYKDDIAGGLMTSEFMTIHKDSTAGEAIRNVRKNSENYRSLYHVFVIDDEKHLLGVVSIRTLLLSSSKQKIPELMSKVVKTLRLQTKFEDIARFMTKYDLLSMAVVDKNKIIRGIVTVDDILRMLIPDA